VAFERFLISNFTRSGYFKALLGAGVGFNLWHYLNILFYTLAGAPNRRELMEPCGKYVFKKPGLAKT
jgi:hypothetical protein